jgi:hypothetical protein
MADHVTEPSGLIQDIAAFFGATTAPELASPDAGHTPADEAAQADVQDDVNEFFGVGGG